MNAVLFCDRIGPDEREVAVEKGQIDLKQWERAPLGY
jgi:hypothetical protein